MAVYITGDTHADFTRFNTTTFPDQKRLTKEDIVIILGDFGGIFDQVSSAQEEYWLNWLSEKNFTICFCDGNHENFDRLYSGEFEEVDFHGGKAHRITDSIYHLMRGYVFNFEGKKFFCMGGAQSHDIQDGILDVENFKSIKVFLNTIKRWSLEQKMFRINHVSWWKEELPSAEEMKRGKQNLLAVYNEVDYVIAHCLPQNVASAAGFYKGDSLTEYFDDLLDSGLKFKKWYCGHYHREQVVLGRFVIKYRGIERIV